MQTISLFFGTGANCCVRMIFNKSPIQPDRPDFRTPERGIRFDIYHRTWGLHFFHGYSTDKEQGQDRESNQSWHFVWRWPAHDANYQPVMLSQEIQSSQGPPPFPCQPPLNPLPLVYRHKKKLFDKAFFCAMFELLLHVHIRHKHPSIERCP